VRDFQMCSMKAIIEAMLRGCPSTHDQRWGDVAVYIPSELERTHLVFGSAVRLAFSEHNVGAREVAYEMQAACRNIGQLDVLDVRDAERHPSSADRQLTLVRSFTQHLRRQASGGLERHPSDHLLYLNNDVFVGEEGEALATAVRGWLRAGARVLMMHEYDEARGACAFDRFFELTPRDLIIDGLYRRSLAIPLIPGSHRAVSLALAAKQLGAKVPGGRLRCLTTSNSKGGVVTLEPAHESRRRLPEHHKQSWRPLSIINEASEKVADPREGDAHVEGALFAADALANVEGNASQEAEEESSTHSEAEEESSTHSEGMWI